MIGFDETLSVGIAKDVLRDHFDPLILSMPQSFFMRRDFQHGVRRHLVFDVVF
jgi:hypothetical protein